MRLLTTSAIFVSLCSVAIAQRSWTSVRCVPHDDNPAELWESWGILKHDEKTAPGSIQKTDYKTVIQNKGSGSNENTNYMYTLHAGIGKLDPAQPNDVVFMAKADRTEGKGLGQQFKVSFWGQDKNDGRKGLMAAFWIMPQQVCHIKTDWAVADLKHIIADNVIY